MLFTKRSTPEDRPRDEAELDGAKLLNTTRNATCLLSSFSFFNISSMVNETVASVLARLSVGKSSANVISGLKRSPLILTTTYTKSLKDEISIPRTLFDHNGVKSTFLSVL